MAWESWAVNGYEHDARIARALASAATGASQGVAAPGDCKVTQTAVASGLVAVAPGAALLRNTYPAAQTVSQSYVGCLPAQETVAVAATGAAARHDLLVVRVSDPDFGGAVPADPLVGPYISTQIISNVAASTTSADELELGYPAVALARIDIPANTATITDGMIVDLRQLAQPRSQRLVLMGTPTMDDYLSSASGEQWPDYAPTVAVPSWATHMQAVVHWSSVGQITGDVLGTYTLVLGVDGDKVTAPQGTYNFDQTSSAWDRRTYLLGADVPVPAAYRGTQQSIATWGTRASGPGSLLTREGTQIIYDVTWVERVS